MLLLAWLAASGLEFNDMQAPPVQEDAFPRPEELQKLLHNASSIKLLTGLASAGKLIEATDERGTPLIVLAFQAYTLERHVSLLHLIGALFDGGGDPSSVRQHMGKTPLGVAASQLDAPLFAELLRRGLSLSARREEKEKDTDILAKFTREVCKMHTGFTSMLLQLQHGVLCARTPRTPMPWYANRIPCSGAPSMIPTVQDRSIQVGSGGTAAPSGRGGGWGPLCEALPP